MERWGRGKAKKEGSVQSKGVRSGQTHVDNILPPASSTLPLEAQFWGTASPEGTAAGTVVTGSPGTAAVVPEFAVVEGLAAHGILGMHIGPILHQDLHTSQQAIAGSQVQGCRAMACLTVRYTTGQRVKGRGKGKGIR